MDPDNYAYTEHTALLEQKCVTYHSLEAELEFCREHKRRPTDDESDDIQTPGWDSDTYGAGVLKSLKSDIESACTVSDVEALISKAEEAVDKNIANIENKILEYPPA